MKKFISSILLVFLTFGTVLYAGNPPATDELSEVSSDEIRVIGVKMDAEWCGKCKVLNPKLNNVLPEFKDEEILFLKFNMTDDFTIQQSALLAERLNLSQLFEEHKGSTGYMVLLNADTGEVLHTLRSDQSEEELIADISETLDSVQS